MKLGITLEGAAGTRFCQLSLGWGSIASDGFTPRQRLGSLIRQATDDKVVRRTGGYFLGFYAILQRVDLAKFFQHSVTRARK